MPAPDLQIVILGPQGAGKGTQASILARRLGLRHLSTGDLLRRAAVGSGPEAEVVRGFIEAGALVPPAIVDALVAAEVRRSSAGCVFDGYPRTAGQAELLDRLVDLHLVVVLQLEVDEVLRRLALRRVCDRCGTTSSTPDSALQVVCSQCHAVMRPRDDDTPHAIRARLDLYERETAPLIDRYRARGILAEVDARGTRGEVSSRVIAAVLSQRRRTARRPSISSVASMRDRRNVEAWQRVDSR